ncbi:hypothetical protein [Sediminivirga luteola]|uniref:hypothetical protein n=1 Tax=Sediminivirga luteola TaxID=1774748 RepID=UPI001F58AA02|nr:hypothetical protein [Sediminivirga luteola]MCI2265258.1 hypothetical protein [Sediminivirga luteola]
MSTENPEQNGTPEEEQDSQETTSTTPDGGPRDEDDLVDEWEEQSFPASDPPAHY